jgi:hypothetical protein
VLRRQLRRTANPLGLWLLNHVETSDIAGSMRIQNRAYREATKAVLALCIYRARHGRLPGSLRELIKQRIIDTLPEDPHSGRALCYCPRRAAVWSIGPSGINRRGQHAHEPHLPGVVLYWAIPASGGDSN